MKKNMRGAGVYLVMMVLVIIALYFLLNNAQQPEEIKYSDIVNFFYKGQVYSFDLDGNTLTMTVKGKEDPVVFEVPYLAVFLEDIKPVLDDYRQDPSSSGLSFYSMKAPKEQSWLLSFVPYILLFGVIILFWYFMMKQAGGGNKTMSFGKAKAKFQSDIKKKITFADVAGADEEKEELKEIVDFLKDPRRYTDIGARIPKGVLLVGPPGTGKTYLAKAVAGEAGVPFLSISGSDFVEMYVGVGASRVRDLFDQAKKNQPAIVFIDEIDAVGRQRGAGLGGGHDEREQTLNQLLVEMDGFETNEGVIIIAATNRPDILDTALLRPGRFDRQVYIGLPDMRAREEILKVHARGKLFESKIDFKVVARGTPGFSPADLENLLNEAALLSARAGKKRIGMKEISDAEMKVIAGPEKRSKVVSEKDRKLTAYHEAGHAVVTRLLPTQPPVHQISIIPRGMAGGYTLALPEDERSYMSKSEMNEEIVSLLGGRVAEKKFLDDISTGASNDIERVTNTARKMVTKYGMSDTLGPIVFGTGHDEVFLGRDFSTSKSFSEEVAAQIDREVKRIVDEAYSRADEILEKFEHKVHEVAAYLLENEKMEADEFNALFEGEDVPEKAESVFIKPDAEDLAPESAEPDAPESAEPSASEEGEGPPNGAAD